MSNDNDQQQTTHFGFETVNAEDKAKRVRGVFDSVASKYDVMNDMMSMGIHRVWKQFTIDLAAVKKGEQVLDLAGGTGDLAIRFAKQVGPEGHVILSDINAAMLTEGRDRLLNKGLVNNVDIVQADAQYLPFADNTFDLITIAFGLRNVTDKELALRSMYRVLKPGGRLMVLEFSKPSVPGLGAIYDQYSFKILPKMGEFIANDADSYRYLAESIRMHPDQETLLGMLQNAGFGRTQYFNLTGGIVALHRGYKL